ncbi:GrpB family protein [Amycolatopsis saalfeldensis]|uniref:GrpB family protein n=1 Tax=Amycolatopsis saalfeldensis TaxID=394193 RepID=UPI000B838EF4|nr:GrpB family protein [Amycolatopsis saalfeldensis]
MTDPPPWAFEKPEIHPPDPSWAARGAAVRARIADLLAPWLAEGVDHIGSTSVPGLAAKPVLDVMASVRDLDEVVAAARARLEREGWCYVPPDLDVGAPWRRFFVQPDETGRHRRAHLHVLPSGHPRRTAQLTFRDALRADPSLAAEYTALKRELTRTASDREAYTQGKTEFVHRVLALRRED